MVSLRNINRLGYYLFRTPIYKIFSLFETLNMPRPSDEFIDVVIPIIPKDLDTLPYCLMGLRKNVLNRIKDIYIVGPDDIRIKEFAKDNHLVYINEMDIFGFGPDDICYITNSGINRSGWLFQQFIKLSGRVGTCDNYITIDSDHILLKPHVFLTHENKFILYRSSEFHWPYYFANKRLLGRLSIPLLSYVAHKMIFNKKILEQLQCELENKHGVLWTDAIISILDKAEASAFSEFELYGNYVDPNQKISKLWLQCVAMRGNDINISNLELSHPKKLSITYPEYLMNRK